MSFLRNFTHRSKYTLPVLVWFFRSIVVLFCGLGISAASDDAPRIAVSIKPLHSLVAAVTRGVSEPMLLMDGSVSPHIAQLKPSTLRLLSKADVLVWVGPGVEVFLSRAVANLDPQTDVISIAQVAGVQRLQSRISLHRQTDQLQHEVQAGRSEAELQQKHQDGSLHDRSIDYHFWIDPQNAQQLVRHLANYLARVDSVNAALYENNAQQLLDSLNSVDEQLAGLYYGLSEVPYLVFHDSFQYLEKRYGLHRPLVIAIQPEVPPGAKRLKQILRQIESENVKCLFSEPQFPVRVVAMLERDSSLQVATLDPLASDYEAGPELFAEWLLELGKTMHDCLSR